MQKKFVKLVHLVSFIIKKFVTMHGHVNVKKILNLLLGFHAKWYYIYPLNTKSTVVNLLYQRL